MNHPSERSLQPVPPHARSFPSHPVIPAGPVGPGQGRPHTQAQPQPAIPPAQPAQAENPQAPAPRMSPHGLLHRARALMIRTMSFYRDVPKTAAWLRERFERLDGPLRIAVTGRVKAGKSTLINALIGQDLAPTDAEERTQVSTIYRYGPEPKITVHTPNGGLQDIPVSTLDTSTIRDLQRWRPDEVARLIIESPSPGLQAITLLETPGVASSTVKETDQSALAQILSEADAVLYLTRHPHQTDVQFLQSVHELRVARSAPINTIVALSRADEASSGGAQALQTADKLAARYRDDPRVRTFAQHVIPVVGLLGSAASQVGTDEIQALAQLAKLPADQLDSLLLSTDRFVQKGPEALPEEHRRILIERFGRFGIETAVRAMNEGARDPRSLSEKLITESRLTMLQEGVHEQFVERAETLRARSALLAIEMVLHANPRPGVQQLRGELERILTNSPDWREMQVLSGLHSQQLRFPDHLQLEAEALLGAHGQRPHERLRLEFGALDADLTQRANDLLARWRDQLVNPLYDQHHRLAIRTILRACERTMGW